MRIFLGGRGEPIPPIALPDPNVADAAVPVILLPENGEVFSPIDYIPLGYTHYEVWCVGAVGAQGADAAGGIMWDYTVTEEHIPDHEWNMILADAIDLARHTAGNPGYYSGNSPLGTPQPPYGVMYWSVGSWNISWQLTPSALKELQNPAHIGKVMNYTNPRPYGYGARGGGVTGGAGGGGGLQVATGRLDELPASVPIIVGGAGQAVPPGQVKVNGVWDPVPPNLPNDPYNWMFYSTPGLNPNESWWNRYPIPHPLYPVPGFGGDGGYSAFGDVCAASGGKGGGPAVIWGPDGKTYFAGHGGDGGKGGRIAAGGGALGALNPQSVAKGNDGVWDPNTRIGEGGGGGRGGMGYIPAEDWMRSI